MWQRASHGNLDLSGSIRPVSHKHADTFQDLPNPLLNTPKLWLSPKDDQLGPEFLPAQMTLSLYQVSKETVLEGEHWVIVLPSKEKQSKAVEYICAGKLQVYRLNDAGASSSFCTRVHLHS